MTPENKVKRNVRMILSDHEAYVITPSTGGYGASGVPDIVACIDGIFIGIECKTKGNKPTKLQLKNLQKIVDAGGFAAVVDQTGLGILSLKLSVIFNTSAIVVPNHILDYTAQDEKNKDED